MAVIGSYPYCEYVTYGPIWHKVEKRYMINLVPIDKSKKRFTMSNARYMMSVHLGRVLLKDEHVDHINDIRTDDRIENFQLLTQAENNKKAGKGRNMVTLVCPICGNEFTRERRKTHLIIKGIGPSKCSRVCAAKWSHILFDDRLDKIFNS